MRVASYLVNNTPRIGVVASDQSLVPVSELLPGGPNEMVALLEAGPETWGRLREAAATASGGESLTTASLLAPIPRPRRNVFCVGWNYSEHFAEGQGMRGAERRSGADP